MVWEEDEIPTRTGRRIRKPETIDDLSELIGKVMAEQVKLNQELNRLRRESQKNSKRPPPIISAGTLSIIVTVTSAIVTAIITVLRETGILK